MPVGGIKRKLFAAHRAGIREVIIPIRNRRDLDEIPPEILAELKVTPVSTVDEVLAIALLPPVGRDEAEDASDTSKEVSVG